MLYRSLRIIRIVVSAIFLVILCVLFFDIHHALPVNAYQLALSQLIPGILQLLFSGLVSAAVIIGIILLLTFVFGRVYCSSICPLGTFMDVINHARSWFKKKKRFRYTKPLNAFRYSILAITALAMAAGLFSLVVLLDPYSNFGRLATNLGRPAVQLINNQVAYIFEATGSYALAPVKITGYQWFSVVWAIIVLAVIGAFTIYGGRLFCNTLCPAGSILSLISRYSLLRIDISREACTLCGKCARVCKATCIDSKLKYVDPSRCVMCFNCFDSCNENAMSLRLKKKPAAIPASQSSAVKPSRRQVLAMMALGFPLVKILKADNGNSLPDGMVPIHKEFPVTPPGSVSFERFNNLCTACHLCITSCPTQVIKPAFFEYGLGGLMQPRMAYEVYYCTFECVRCTEVCPTGALQPVSLEEKKTLQLGKVVFVRENCIVITKKKDCGACSEHCPTKAVKMVQQPDKLFLPVVEPKICVGCGACEHACPTDPKSIYVEGNPVHLKAEKPVTKKVEEKVEEDFPF